MNKDLSWPVQVMVCVSSSIPNRKMIHSSIKVLFGIAILSLLSLFFCREGGLNYVTQYVFTCFGMTSKFNQLLFFGGKLAEIYEILQLP